MQKMAIETNELLNVYMEELDQRRRISANISSSATTQRERGNGYKSVNLEAADGPSYAVFICVCS